MSERERWIVYPLLFLALGAALRDKLLKQTSAEQIVCERLILVNNEDQPTAVLRGDSSTPLSPAEVEMARSGGARIAASFVYSGLVESETFTQRGKPLGQQQEQQQQFLFRLMRQLWQEIQKPSTPPAARPAAKQPAVEPAGDA